ncbi:MAG: anion permease [Caldilineaceae bacterium]|nr:anion permease [Caldilineaceae bacterium]
MKSTYWKALVPVVVAVVIALIPPPAGLEIYAWRYFAVFIGVVLGLILEPLPAAAIGFIGAVAMALLGLPFSPADRAAEGFSLPSEAIKWVLSGFGNTTVWLIFAAFMLALGYQKTGLGRRLGLLLVEKLGRRTLGLGYAVALADLILAPFTPSNTARSGGTIFPIIRNIPSLYGSEPGETSRKIGSYIMWTALATTTVTSSMFITALAPNLLAVEIVKRTVDIDIAWMQWFLGFIPVGAVLFLLVPFLTYILYPPEIKTSNEVPAWARQELKDMGPFSRNELIMALLALLALVLWIVGGNFIHGTMVALAVICLMLITHVIEWDDMLANKPAWNVLVWFATLVTLAGGLSKVGFVDWFSNSAAGMLTGMAPMTVMIILVVLFFVVHYLFASVTAHVTAVLPVFLAAGAAVPGINMMVFTLLLCFSLGIMGIITPYGTGPSPVYFGSGYISRKDFWVMGSIFGLIFLVLFLVIEIPYLLAIY